MYDAYLVGLTCLFHAFSAGVCWRARRVAGLRTARCAANCADLCAASCAARSAEPCEALCSLFKKSGEKIQSDFAGISGIFTASHEINFAVFWVNFGMPINPVRKSAESPGCPLPSWRWGFHRRSRTLPSSLGGKEKQRPRERRSTTASAVYAATLR